MRSETTLSKGLEASVRALRRDFRVFPWDVGTDLALPEIKRDRGVVVEGAGLPSRRGAGGDLGVWRRGMGSPEVRQALSGIYGKLLAAIPEDDHWVVAIASALDEEGRTTVATSLASMLAEDLPGQVLLVDGHIERPGVHDLLDLALAPGFSDCLDAASLVLNAVRRSGDLLVLPAGHGMQALSAGDGLRTREVMRPIRQLFKVTVVDLPPALGSPDAALISRWADAVIWVVRSETTSFGAVKSALRLVGREKLLGVVLNARQERVPAWLEKYI